MINEPRHEKRDTIDIPIVLRGGQSKLGVPRWNVWFAWNKKWHNSAKKKDTALNFCWMFFIMIPIRWHQNLSFEENVISVPFLMTRLKWWFEQKKSPHFREKYLVLSYLKEVRGSFAILFWLPCATWHRVMTHTHHTQPFRSTDAFLRHSTPGPISEVSWGFLLHPSGLSFGFQARCTGSTRTNKRRRFQKSSVVDWMMPASEEWIRRKRRRRRSIDEQASGCMVDLLNLSWAVLCGRQCDFPFFVLVDLENEQSFVYYGGGRLQHKTPVGADNVDSGECIHNQLVSISLAVLYFNLHFSCLALMH